MKKFKRIFNTSIDPTHKNKSKQDRIKHQLENDYNAAKKKGDKITELKLQRAYFSHLANLQA
ncbi:MAG: hypothetical protein PW786_12130 [Arachidicoccus sp.]|nr:hypothetical protein [Arachidicoccus sp.]